MGMSVSMQVGIGHLPESAVGTLLPGALFCTNAHHLSSGTLGLMPGCQLFVLGKVL